MPMWAEYVASSFEDEKILGSSRSLLSFAQSVDPEYTSRPHLDYLDKRLAQAMRDLTHGKSRQITVSMPPREGKSQMVSVNLPLWILSKHPDWKIGLISHSPTLAAGWGRQIRREVEEHGDRLRISIAPDAGAVTDWETTERGSVLSRSAPGQSVTGKGFNVLIIDDIVKDFADAHSKTSREAIWDWWKANAYSRMEPPSLIVVVGTRWHDDDFIGRLLSPDYEGNPNDWEVISFPAIAETTDVLGRQPGQPLFSPIINENEEQALERWGKIRESVGEYAWAGLYMQKPQPATGAIFKVDSFRYWTSDASLLREGDDSVVFVKPEELSGARWFDSWDATFKGTDSSDYVVGQRWAMQGKKRFLVDQSRGRRSFTETLDEMRKWDSHLKTGSKWVYEKLIEDAANGPAIIDTLKKEMDGIKPITPRSSKEARARAVTPELEGGFVYLPHPSMPGYEWVTELVSEFRAFPNSTNDDQVDAFTQALNYVRSSGEASITVPGRVSGTNQRTTTVPRRGSINSRRVAR